MTVKRWGSLFFCPTCIVITERNYTASLCLCRLHACYNQRVVVCLSVLYYSKFTLHNSPDINTQGCPKTAQSSMHHIDATIQDKYNGFRV